MALFYDVRALYDKHSNKEEHVVEELIVYVEQMSKRLDKMKKHIDAKNYEKLQKHVTILQPIVEILGMDQASEEFNGVQEWIAQKGKTKEIKEVYKSLRKHLRSAVKEIKKDYQITVE
ncbi:hypothetical protein [Myroides sp. WP-1]|uniref:hypothetical protein n=1 Tax=Myroides sp. WP-1 TaxID=2759944 RepID=UPI0015FA963C|nr:hypothetical protein [Myroides sp. WP-1]MBB1138538.1 hypothetical protein [Myroides sp. WP-1]